MTPTLYKYIGDRHTEAALRGAVVSAVRRADGKCIRGRNGNMLVQAADGTRLVVMGRLLRKIKT